MTSEVAECRDPSSNPIQGIISFSLLLFAIKGSFTIIDIYESVHSVRFLMTPSPLPRSVL